MQNLIGNLETTYGPFDTMAFDMGISIEKEVSLLNQCCKKRQDLKTAINSAYRITSRKFIDEQKGTNMKIKNVIFNKPATIVFWDDGSKTVVKADEETFDPEKGLAMAIAKKALGNKGNYYNTFKKWLPKEEPKYPSFEFTKKLSKMVSAVNTDLKPFLNAINMISEKEQEEVERIKFGETNSVATNNKNCDSKLKDVEFNKCAEQKIKDAASNYENYDQEVKAARRFLNQRKTITW